MGEGQPGCDGGDLQGAPFGAAVAFVPGLVRDGVLPPGQGGELGVQAGLVALDGDQVVRAALSGQVLGVGALGVKSIRGDDRPGQSMRSSKVANMGISFVLASTPAWPRTTPCR
jgi:hypothetical protein